MKDNGIKYGVIAGIGIVFFMIIFYTIDKRLMLNTGIYWSTILIAIAGMVIAGIEDRKLNKDELSFKDALKTTFVVWIVSGLIYYIFYFFFFKYFDPELVNIQKEIALEQLEKGASLLGEDMIEKMADQIQNQNFEVTIGSTFNSYAIGLIGGFIISAIVSAIIKR